MPPKTLDQIRTMVGAASTGAEVVKVVQSDGGDVWSNMTKFFDKVMEFADKYDSRFNKSAQESPMIQSGSPSPHMIDMPPVPPRPPGTKDDKLQKILATVIPELIPFVDRCVAENPDMPLGQMLARLDMLSAKEIKLLLQIYHAKEKK